VWSCRHRNVALHTPVTTARRAWVRGEFSWVGSPDFLDNGWLQEQRLACND
jgi:hypothetical protein